MTDLTLALRVLAETREAEARLRDLTRQLDQMGGGMRRTGTETAGLARGTAELETALGGAGRAAAGVAGAFAAVGVSVAGMTLAASNAVRAFAAAEAQGLRLEAVIAATGGAASRSAADVERLVQDLARLGAAAGADQIRNAATQRLTFPAVAAEEFDRALRAALDLSATGFGSVESAAVQLGKALQSPAEALAGLTRVGVTFTDEQQRLIRSLVETGRTAEAQRVVLAAVEEAARAAGLAEEPVGRLLDAWSAAQGLSGTDIAGPIAAARLEAQALGREIGAAFAAVARLGQRLAERRAEAELRLRYAGDPVGLAGAMARREAEAAPPPIPDFGDASMRHALDADRRRRIEATVQQARAAEAAWQAALAAEREIGRAASGKCSGGRGGGGAGGAARDAVADLQRQVAQLPAELGIAAAAAAGKMRAGLIGAAEAGDAMAEAKRRAADRLAELLARLDAPGPAGEAAAEQARAALAARADEVSAGVGPALEGAARRLEGAFENAFTARIKGSRDAGRMMVDAVLTERARLACRQWVQPLLSPLLSGLFGALPFARGGVVPFAAGGVLGDGAAPPPLRTFRERVVAEPTLFALGDGAGLMGEAGAEAILPLVRGPSGEGVRALLAGGDETIAPLARAASGHLAIRLPANVAAADRAFAQGGVAAAGPACGPGMLGPPAAPPPVGRGYRLELHDTARRTEFEVAVRARRMTHTRRDRPTLSVRLTDREFEAFRAWWGDEFWSLAGGSDDLATWQFVRTTRSASAALGPDEVPCDVIVETADSGLHHAQVALAAHGWPRTAGRQTGCARRSSRCCRSGGRRRA